MKVREFETGVELTPELFLLVKMKVFTGEGVASGYNSTVKDYGHVFMCDVERVKRRTIVRGDEAMLLVAKRLVHTYELFTTLAVIRTDTRNYHLLSLDLMQANDYMVRYHDVMNLLPSFLEADTRHLAMGYLKGEWTLRMSKKDAPRSKGVALTGYTMNDRAPRPWSYQHLLLLRKLSSSKLPAPPGPRVDRPLSITRYQI